MDIPKETQEKIMQLQQLEQNLQRFLLQKQHFQTQMLEIENALEELSKSKGEAYKIIGTIMVSSDKDGLKKELAEKKEILELKLKNLEKQEDITKEKATKLQAEVMEKLKGK